VLPLKAAFDLSKVSAPVRAPLPSVSTKIIRPASQEGGVAVLQVEPSLLAQMVMRAPRVADSLRAKEMSPTSSLVSLEIRDLASHSTKLGAASVTNIANTLNVTINSTSEKPPSLRFLSTIVITR
jgi:hypothetical protein